MEITGQVMKGLGKAGQYYAVPTANIRLLSLPELHSGIYAGSVVLDNGQRYPGVICFDGLQEGKFEVHLFGWSGDLYDQQVKVEVGEKVSEFVPFQSEEQMRAKIAEDVARARVILGC